jgi:hypothetical protein
MPLVHYIINVIDPVYEVLNKILFASEFRAGVNGFLNSYKDFLILTMRIVILSYEHKNIVDIDLYLLDKFYLKDNIVIDPSCL